MSSGLKADRQCSEQDVSWTSCAVNAEAVDPLIPDGVCEGLVCEGLPQLAILSQHKTNLSSPLAVEVAVVGMAAVTVGTGSTRSTRHNLQNGMTINK
jgi:hypothetical protein